MTSGDNAGLEAEVIGRMGILPSFFSSGITSAVTQELWKFARSAYLDNPLPAAFKERLFVHLSRHCNARYCLVRHVGFLLGKGKVAGSDTAPAQTIDQVLDLLALPLEPDDEQLDHAIRRLRSQERGETLYLPGSQAEWDIFLLASKMFVDPMHAARAKEAVRHAMGSEDADFLMAMLAFVRTAHYWTLLHPEIAVEPDMAAILDERPDLAEALAARPGAGESDLVRRLRAEIDTLVQQEDDRSQLRQVIADREAAYDRLALLNRELNHRVKNLFAVISGLIRQSAKGEGDSEDWARNIQARINALGAAHSVTSDDEQMRPVPLDELVRAVLEPYRNEKRLIVRGGPPALMTQGQLTPLGMVLHELATNAVKYGGLSPAAGADGKVSVGWQATGDDLEIDWRESAPTLDRTAHGKPGFGSRLIDGSVRQLGGSIDRKQGEGALDIRIRIPGLARRESRSAAESG